ncbi:MAG: endo-1,4-beta-xylanase [Rhodobacteraceae bacterium]|nr:endo-1,4-beta-xylanase [Paracoccaceae bacterium]
MDARRTQSGAGGPSRREVALGGLAALGAAAMIGPAAAGTPPETLAEAGRRAGIEVGSAIRGADAGALADMIATECTLVTPENALKPPRLAPAEGRFTFDEASAIFDFAAQRGLSVHGHTLYWHKQPLGWAVAASRGKGLAETVALYGTVLERILKRFPAAGSWDVFNEIAGYGGQLRPDPEIDRFGLDFVERLLWRARETAPEVALAINENDLECGACGTKREHVLAILAALKARGAPLDALGVQGHLVSRDRPDAAAMRDFLRRVEDLGLVIYLSELDVNDARLSADYRLRDTEVAQIYADYLGPALEVRAVRRVVFWGIADSANWIADGGAERRSDGKRQRPALFDRELGRKPAYYAVREALAAAPAR